MISRLLVRPRGRCLLLALSVGLTLPACGAKMESARSTTPAYEGDMSRAETAGMDMDAPGGMAPPAEAPVLLASAPVAPQPAASDGTAVRSPLLIYTAAFQLSVFEVEKSQREAKALAAELGGFVSQQTQTRIAIRVPAPRFEEAVAKVEHMGKVLGRQIEALDVGEQYRDLSLRLRTLEAMRGRLEELLARAGNVKEALEVEKELERVLSSIEQLKGQLRSLDDRIAYSTLTLDFMPTPQPALDQGAVFRLPFPWLEELGVHSLLEVSR